MDNDIYKTPESNLITEGNSETELASRISRLAASIVDGISIMIVTIPLMYFTGMLEDIQQGIQPPWHYSVMVGAVGLLVFFVINGNLLVNRGQTLGKKVLGIKIVDLEGNLPGAKSHLLPRYATYFVPGYIPVVGSLLSMANILFIFGKQRRCVHDLVAGTKVINA